MAETEALFERLLKKQSGPYQRELGTLPYAQESQTAYVSPTVTKAKTYLQSAMEQKPQGYQSPYAEQIASLYRQIMNRPRFAYDAGRDPLYRQYQAQYLRNGRQAMEDTLGLSAALTGGYGNSWGTTAGYQAYQNYLEALNDKLPELEQQARERYDAEENALRGNADLLLNLDNREYGWYRDGVNDWQFDAKLALEQAKFDLEMRKYQDALLESLAKNGGGSGGSGGGTRRTELPATPAKKTEEALYYPPLPANAAALQTNPAAPSVLSPVSAKGFTPQEWVEAQQKMREMNQRSFQTQAKALGDGSLTSLMLNAAKQGVVRRAVEEKKK